MITMLDVNFSNNAGWPAGQLSDSTDQHSEINKVNYGSKWIIKYYQQGAHHHHLTNIFIITPQRIWLGIVSSQ